MTEHDNELRGGVWDNKNQREGKRDPDFTGRCQIGGVVYYVDIWENSQEDVARGRPRLGIRFKPKNTATDSGRQQSQQLRGRAREIAGGENRGYRRDDPPVGAQPEFNDEIPF
jgi:hypothetical protein